jgi:ribosomal protein S18 acetylase RimI-like enzyme
MDWELRRAKQTDVEAIRNLTRAAYAKWVPVLGREPKPMGADYGSAVQKHRFDLLYVDNVLAGLIETVDEKTQLLIENVAVSPAFQRRGLGLKLMAHAEKIAASLGYGRVWLYTNKRFTENVEFYLSLGYRVDREEDVGGGTIKVDMSKTLGAPTSIDLISVRLRPLGLGLARSVKGA